MTPRSFSGTLLSARQVEKDTHITVQDDNSDRVISIVLANGTTEIMPHKDDLNEVISLKETVWGRITTSEASTNTAMTISSLTFALRNLGRAIDAKQRFRP